MKKTCITFLCLAIMVLTGVGLALNGGSQNSNAEYLRIHIRANSNGQIDQSVKYKVKERVVNFVTPFVAECNTKADAEKMLRGKLRDIERVADEVLKKEGFTYTSRARINEEEFPTRTYDDLVLEAGFYDALILELGSGKGDNWWCVVYPPLCFTGGGTNYIYKSKIQEIIDGFFGR